MAKSGQARVIKPAQFSALLDVVQTKRHPEKNTALLQLSMKLGLRVQEIALLEIKEVARLSSRKSGELRGFKLLDIMPLPASYTKGANALRESTKPYERKRVSFTTAQFEQICRQIELLAKAGADVEPEMFYPPVIEHQGKSRDLPLVDVDLRNALEAYLHLRLQQDPNIKPSSPLFLTQKKVPYSPNTLQEHFALMWREWGGIEGAKSHSGRRSVLSDIVSSTQNKNALKVAQKIAGHKSAATTLIYTEPGEADLTTALVNVGKTFNSSK